MILVARNGRSVLVGITTNVAITMVEAVGETVTVVVTTAEVEATTTALTIPLPTGETREAIEEALLVAPSLMPRVSR